MKHMSYYFFLSMVVLCFGFVIAQELPHQVTGQNNHLQASGQRGDLDLSAAQNAGNRFEEGGIAGNPVVVNLVTGTGKLFQRFGLDPYSGITLGGVYIGESSSLLTRGLVKRRTTWNSLFVASLSIDTYQFMRLPGGLFDVEFLQFNGQLTNAEAGVVMGFDNIPGLPLEQSKIFQLWYRQSLDDDHFVIRVGRTIIPTDFNNVIHPVGLRHDPLAQEATTGLIYRPINLNAALFGLVPGIFTSVYGGNFTWQPRRNIYFSYGIYDGHYALDFDREILQDYRLRGKGTYLLQLFEAGCAWRLGKNNKPGSFGIGAVRQSGKLTAPLVKNEKVVGLMCESGAVAWYLIASQRLWFAHPGVDTSGLVGTVQFGMNDSITRPVPLYGGASLTAFGLVPRRGLDSFGMGVAACKLNENLLPRPSEFMFQAYYQAHLIQASYFVAALSYVPNPGLSRSIRNIVALTGRLIILF